MIKSIKQITKFMAVVLLLALGSCEKELYDEVIHNENKKTIIRDISLKDLNDSKINAKLLEKVNEVKEQTKRNVNGKIVYDSINNFYFDDEHGKYIEDGIYHSYTFPVYRETSDEKIEKLLFSLKSNGDYATYLVKYNFTEEEMKNLALEQINEKEIEIKNIANKNGFPEIMCSYEYQLVEVYNTGNGGVTTADPGTHWELISTGYTCWAEYDEGGIGDTAAGGITSAGGGIQSSGTSTTNGTTIMTSPSGTHITPSEKKFLDFIFKLDQDQQDFVEDTNNSAIKSAIKAYLVQNNFSSESVSFMNWGINYLIANPTTSFIQFQNQFMGTSEGTDGTYDAAYWDNPNLTFPTQSLPSYNNFVASFPRNLDGSLMAGADNVYSYVGGDVWQTRLDYPSKTENTCALKVSRALNYSGVIIPNIPGQTIKGADNKFYFLNSKKLNKWMRLTFGIPTGSNHISALQAGLNGVNLPSLLNGKKGIYSLVSSNSTWAYGHVDFLKSDATCGVNCHFYDAPIDYIDIWILN